MIIATLLAAGLVASSAANGGGACPEPNPSRSVRRVVLSDESRGRLHYYDSSDPAKCFFVEAEKTNWDLRRIGPRESGKIGRYRFLCQKGFKVWQAPARNGLKGHFFGQVHELANGHLVLSNWTGHRANDSKRGWQLIEFDEQGCVVWTLYDPVRFGSIHGFSLLEWPGLDDKM